MDTYGNYISGDYGLKYYKTILLKKEDPSSPYTNAVCIEIHEKDYDGANKEIGDLQNIRVTLQGDRDTIDSPIVKTSLSFTLVDTWDEPDTENVKHGNWQEFYTPDSTKFLVKLIFEEYNRSGDLVDSHPIWSGYVTPDSWQESLAYRGSITVTARDNIGHLQDFEFDLTPDSDGLVSIRDIITGAMQKVNLPLDFIINADTEDYSHGIYNEYEGVNIIDTLVNASLFEGDDWYSVLEDVLEGLGFVLRFGWRNDVAVGPIRNLSHLSTTEGALPADDLELTFLGGGIRTIDPPYRSIREEMRYDYNSDAELDINSGLAGAGLPPNSLSYTIEGYELPDGTHTSDKTGSMPAYQNVGTLANGWAVGAFLDTDLYGVLESVNDPNAEGESFKDYAFIPANTDVDISAKFSFFAMSPEFTLHVTFARRAAYISNADPTKVGPYYDLMLYQIVYDVTYESGGTTYYWNGVSWVSTAQRLTAEYEVGSGAEMATELDVQLHAASNIGEGKYAIRFYRIVYKMGFGSYDTGVYARLGSISVSANVPHTVSDTVTTINDESFNVRFTRTPALGVLSNDAGRIVVGNYENILYFRPSIGKIAPYPYNLTWDGAIGRWPLPVLIHMQLLTNHLEPMEILEGDCMVEGAIFPGRTFKYKGKRFLLVSGTYDPLAGRYVGATLREFQEYSDVWEGNNARTPATSSKRKTSRS